MVKRFRRSAAGDDEQLPSDIRPPLVLQKTLNYLLEEVVNGPEALWKVHKFVWDRTRAIRNDFSIQQVTKPEDVQIAMDCFERIARFHILALHQLCLPENAENSDFDPHQELEQLNKTLLSLTYYYDDNRDKVNSPNEAEFRAYTIMIEIQYPRPELERRALGWREPVFEDRLVQLALRLYAACGDGQGVLFAGTRFEIPRASPRSFFVSLKSDEVPYLLACVAEIFFYHIRSLILESIWRAYQEEVANSVQTTEWLEADVQAILGYDDERDTRKFLFDHGLDVTTVNKKDCVDLRREFHHYYRGRQIYSQKIVEAKRVFRTYLEITNGLAPPQEGIEEAIEDLRAAAHEAYEPLFVSDDSDDEEMGRSPTRASPSEGDLTNTGGNPTTNPPTESAVSSSLANSISFGKPTPGPLPITQNNESSTKGSSVPSQPQPTPNFNPFKGHASTMGANPSTSNPPAQANQSPFTQRRPNSPSRPKIPVGKWPFPKITSNDSPATKPSAASSNPTFTNPSAQVSSDNTNAQPSTFVFSNPLKPTSPNPASQVSWADQYSQLGSSALSSSLKPTSPNPAPQVPWADKYSQSGSSGFSSSLKPTSPNPAPQVSWADKYSQSGSSGFSSSSKPSPQSSQVSPDNTNSWPVSSPFSDSLNAMRASGMLGAASSPSWKTQPVLQEKPVIPMSFTKHSPVVPAPSPFTGSFHGMHFSNHDAAASLPSWKATSSSQITRPVQKVPANSSPVPPPPSPFSGSFRGMQFSNPHGAAFLPSWTVHSSNQNTATAPSSSPQPAPPTPSSTEPLSFQDPPRPSFSTPTSLSAVSLHGAPSSNAPGVSSPTNLSQMPFSTMHNTPSVSNSPIGPSTTPFRKSLPPFGLSSKSPSNISGPLATYSNPGISSSTALSHAPPLPSSQHETLPSAVQNMPFSSEQPERSPAALQNVPLSSTQSKQSEKQNFALEHTTPLPSSQPGTATPKIPNIPISSSHPESPISMPPVTEFSSRKAEEPKPPVMNLSSNQPRTGLLSSNTQILALETSQTPAVTLTFPSVNQASNEASKPTISIPPTSSGSSSLGENQIPSDKTTPELPSKGKASTSPSSSPAETAPTSVTSLAEPAQQAKSDLQQSNRRSETIDALSKAIMLEKGCLLEQFFEFHMSSIVKDCIGQLEDEKSRKEADEYRVMMLSKKYLKKWRTNAWKMGLIRKAPERRRRFKESLRELARDMARQKENLEASLLSQKSETQDRQQKMEGSPESILQPSTSHKKRKSPDVDYHCTPDRNKRRRASQIHAEHPTPSGHMKDGQTYYKTVNPKLSETEDLINLLIATRSDYSYLANGSVSSERILQKIRVTFPPMKLDNTRSDYFLLKSRGIDPDTPVIPRTSRKRHSGDETEDSPSKRLKESPLMDSASTLSQPSYNRRTRSQSSLLDFSHKPKDRSTSAKSIDFDETEKELLAVQRKLNSKMTDVIEWYREQRAKWGSGRISTSSPAPNRSIEYYKEQRAKWGTPLPSTATNPRQYTPFKPEEVRSASEWRSSVQPSGFGRDRKSAVRAAIERRQRELYATMQPGPSGPGCSILQEKEPAGQGGASVDDAIEL